jgi:ATP/maltotriose-dependent transcriptional regulator MalT
MIDGALLYAAAPRKTPHVEPLDAAHHERQAVDAYLLGNDDATSDAWEGAYRAHLDAGDRANAARCAFWLGLCLMLSGREAQASGWLTRTQRLVETIDDECAALGYLLIPELLGALAVGDATGAYAAAHRATEIGARLSDPDLCAFGILGQGQALIAQGDTAMGVTRLDEVMVSVVADELSPVTAGIVYCAVILECMGLFDLARASEWTDALSDWCDAHAGMVPYRGQCLVHRSQLQQAAGDWTTARVTIDLACERLADPPHPALGLAHYQRGELARLHGDLDAAEAEYRTSNRLGFSPMPGFALLELTRGDIDAACATIRRALHETVGTVDRPRLLAAAVEIFRTAGDTTSAHVASEELAGIAQKTRCDTLDALSAQSTGAVRLSEGDPAGALRSLRDAAATWHRLNLHYDAARTSVLLGLSCAALDDHGSARLEFEDARRTFKQLGAGPDLAGVPWPDSGTASALSPRERQVLTQVASGKTNREIADALTISQHTVGRHLENIFSKLGVTSRAAAIARAYESDLL